MADSSIAERTWTVYMLTCVPSGKKYIGITINLRQRWNNHVSEAKRNHRCSRYLCHSIRKYGRSAFTVRSLYEAVTRKEAEIVERGLVAAYGTLAPIGMNMTSGGEGTQDFRRPHSEETKRKISLSNLNRTFSAEAKEKMGAAKRGISLSAAHCAALSAARAGKPKSETWKQSMSRSTTGKKYALRSLGALHRALKKTVDNPSAGITKEHNKWSCRTIINGRRVHLGMFVTKEDAHAAYKQCIVDRIAHLQKTLPSLNPTASNEPQRHPGPP